MADNTIVACIDNSDLGQSVINHAIYLAKDKQVSLTFLHTIEHSHQTSQTHHEGNLTPNSKEHLLDELSTEERIESKQKIIAGKALLDAAKQKAEQAGLQNTVTKQRHGNIAEALVDIETEASLVILGASGEKHQGDKQGLGSQLEEAIRAVHIPVMIVKGTFTEPKKVMLAYNGSPTSIKALELIAQGELISSSAEVHIVSVQPIIDDAEALVEHAATLFNNSDNIVITKALHGEALQELRDYQSKNEIDMTVMGAFSHGKIHGFFFGSFTTRMLLESKSCFLLIR